MKFVIITGMSGAGKSLAVKAFEDIDYYCMDNLPPSLLPDFAKLWRDSSKKNNDVAIVVDIRGGVFFNDLFTSLDILKSEGLIYEILFLDASDEVLIKRFKEHRRPHPADPTGRMIDAIALERQILKEVKEKADHIIDTTSLTNAMLKEEINEIFLMGHVQKKITISIVSFGFKAGIPMDCDLVFDVRFLPNPHYIEEMRDMNGNDKIVQDYVMKFEQSNIFLQKLDDMLKFLMPYYQKEGKTQLVIGVGCTGGKHRSVTISNLLAEIIEKDDYRTIITHRDIYR
ncbi:MAG TPA: RNase adapter RapZ [Clostridiales bacterium]|jgi:UPF0042 nucleotide-binding protein|nr:RNase adapter RapZ [Clostridiales bacterium]